MKTVASLRDIPAALFEEFTAGTGPRQSAVFRGENGQYLVTIAPCRMPGRVRPLTLVLEETRSAEGSFIGGSLSVFAYPMNVESFDPEYDGHVMKPEFEVFLNADDPPADPSARWEEGKGFWVEEFIGTAYKDGIPVMTGEASEVDVIRAIRDQAVELAGPITSPGHWQFEWHPQGDYSHKPHLSRR